MPFNTAVFRVRGRGCAGCVEPIKIHLFKHPGVRGVHIRGYNVYIVYDPRYSIEEIIRETGVLDYYELIPVENREYPWSTGLDGRRGFRLFNKWGIIPGSKNNCF